MEILGMDGVSAWVSDMERSAAFYALVLGLEEDVRAPGAVTFDAGLETITLREWATTHGDEPFPPPRGEGLVPVLQVDDLQALERRLESAEAEMERDEEPGEAVRSLTFLDPDGHRWRAIEFRGPAAPSLLAQAEAGLDTEAD